MRGKFFAALVIGVIFSTLGAFAADITIGTGTGTWNYPLSTGYHDARTQTIYLASEIGGAKTLNSLALNVSTLPGQVMNYFTIRLKHTDLSSYGASPVWESSGWTTVYQANKTISAAGWTTFSFTTSFAYNGTQNLMVDISFNNSSYTYDGYCYYTLSGVSRSIYYRTNSGYGDPLTWTSSNPPPTRSTSFSNIRLGYVASVVPDVVGMTQTAAQAAITAAGLTVGNVTQALSDSVPAGNVISQLPAANAVVNAGSAVNLVISLGVEIPNPVTWWRFDNYQVIGEDSMGISNLTGKVSCGLTWEGKIGYAAQLSGDGYFVAEGYKGITGSRSRTCCAWIKTTAVQQGNIISWGTEQNGQRWSFRTEANGTLCVGVYGGQIFTTATVNDGQWHHVAAILNDDGSPNVNEILLYIDGVLQGTSATSTQSINTIAYQDVMIGAFDNAGTKAGFFIGYIDDVRIYNTALSSSQIQYIKTIPFGGGNGTYGANSFYISTAQDLYTLSVRPDYWTYSFSPMSDIDLTQTGQLQANPIGTDAANPFSGNFEGNYRIIKGLTQTTDEGRYVGLFGYLQSYNGFTTIRNLTLVDAKVTVSGNGPGAAGFLCGYGSDCDIRNCALINCSITADVDDITGTLAGELRNTTVRDITCTATVQGGQLTGGLIGRIEKCRIFDCAFQGIITDGQLTGGLFGRCEQSILNNCNFNGTIEGALSTGCLAGEILGSSISCSTNTGTVRGGPLTGGFFGRCDHTSIYNCSFEGDVYGTISTGGFAGKLDNSTVNKCSSNGTVTGDSSVGGFVGEVSAINILVSHIKDCFSQGRVTGNQKVGGFVGDCLSSCSIQHCYSAEIVTGADQVGAFSGYSDLSADYLGCFWDTQINPGLPGISSHCAAGLTGETTMAMQSQQTYLNAGWDFVGETINGQAEIWAMSSLPAYPTLRLATAYPGSGTPSDPYRIYVAEHLLNPLFIGESDYDNNINIKIMNDIDFQGGYCPVLFQQWGFKGVFDGNFKSIKNISMIDQTGFIRGIFDPNSILKNLTLQSPVLTLTDENIYFMVGLLAGEYNRGTIDNCHVIGGKIYGSLYYDDKIWGTYASGITNNNEGVIRNTSFSGIIRAAYAAGIAESNSWIIENSSASVDMLSSLQVGGAVGANGGLIRNCSTNGRIESQATEWHYAGGLVAINFGISSNVVSDPFDAAVYGDGGGIILDSHSSCDVVANNCNAVGGLVGISWSGAIKNCSASGSVTGYGYTGGLIGTIQTYVGDNIYPGFKYKGIIENCYATGNVNGNNRLGGFAGENGNCTIRNCYSTGNVTGSWRMGGFVGCVYDYPYAGGGSGHGPSIIDRCYSIGKVIGSSDTGGFLGRISGSQVITRSFWDVQTSGWTSSAAGTGKTTAEMKTQSTFAEWDFANTWYMTGYPSLKWEINPLQAQIDAAANGATIVVQPGLYQGRLYFKGKNITLTSTNPQDPNTVASTIIQGLGIGSVITFAGTETSACCLRGFTITGGNSATNGGGVNGNNCGAIIQNCRFYGNTAANVGGGIWGVHGLIENCIVYQNTAAYAGGIGRIFGPIRNCLIYDNQAPNAAGMNNCDGAIENCTIVSKQAVSLLRDCDGTMKNCIFSTPGFVFDISTASISYSCWPGATGTGNISFDPMFVDSANGNYHLLPDSPCIDAGDPASDYSHEPWPNGSRIDMGAYGNTIEAALSSNVLIPLGFQIVNKSRVGRTSFEYQLAVTVRNPNSYDMTNVQMKLKDWDAAVLSVSDDSITIDTILSGATVTSTDTFTIVVDRSVPIVSGMLTWQLMYYTVASGDQVQQAMMSMLLSDIDAGVSGDISGDGKVNFDDFAILAGQWDDAPGNPSADIAPSPDGHVWIEDLMYLAENWMK